MSAEFDIRVVPRSSREKVEVNPDGTLKVWTHSAPVEGEANEAVIALLSKLLGVGKSHISILRGHASRSKRIRVEGIEPSEALKRLS